MFYADPVSIVFTPAGKTESRILIESMQPSMSSVFPGGIDMEVFQSGLIFSQWGHHTGLGSAVETCTIEPLFGFQTIADMWKWREEFSAFVTLNQNGKIRRKVDGVSEYEFNCTIKNVSYSDPNPFPDCSDMGFPGKFWIVAKIDMLLTHRREISGRTLVVDPSTMLISASGGSRTVSVTSSHSWIISGTIPSWVSVAPMDGGAGSSSLSVTAQINVFDSARTAVFRISQPEGLEENITVNQSASSMTATVAPSSLSFDWTGATKSVSVTSDTNWTVETTLRGASVTPTSGVPGTTTVYVTVPRNTESGPKTGILNVLNYRGEVMTSATLSQVEAPQKTVTVTGEPAYWDNEASGWIIAWQGDYTILYVTSNYPWSVVVPDGVKVVPSSGGPGQNVEIQVSMVLNPSPVSKVITSFDVVAAGIPTTVPLAQAMAWKPDESTILESPLRVSGSRQDKDNWIFMTVNADAKTDAPAWLDTAASYEIPENEWFNDKISIQANGSGSSRTGVLNYSYYDGETTVTVAYLDVIQDKMEFRTQPASPVRLADYRRYGEISATSYIPWFVHPSSIPANCYIFPLVGDGNDAYTSIDVFTPVRPVSGNPGHANYGSTDIPFSLLQYGGNNDIPVTVIGAEPPVMEMDYFCELLPSPPGSSGVLPAPLWFDTPFWIWARPGMDYYFLLTDDLSQGLEILIDGQPIRKNAPIKYTAGDLDRHILRIQADNDLFYLPDNFGISLDGTTFSQRIQFSTKVPENNFQVTPTDIVFSKTCNKGAFAVWTMGYHAVHSFDIEGVVLNGVPMDSESVSGEGYQVYIFEPNAAGEIPTRVSLTDGNVLNDYNIVTFE